MSITGLEFSYTQAPTSMKSWVMALYPTSVSMGNAFTALVNACIREEDGSSRLSGVQYYLFFASAMAAVAVAFVPVAIFYRETAHMQHSEAAESARGAGLDGGGGSGASNGSSSGSSTPLRPEGGAGGARGSEMRSFGGAAQNGHAAGRTERQAHQVQATATTDPVTKSL